MTILAHRERAEVVINYKMTTLVLFTVASKLLIRIAINELMRDSNTLVVDTSHEVHGVLKAHNISSIHLSPAKNVRFDWGERDSNFREIFMDGPQLKCEFPDTTLPVWKVVALDRFSFWFTHKESAELFDAIMALNWDRCITSADLNSDLPWTLARYSGRPVWGVKVSGFRTREWYDLMLTGNVPFEKILVSSESDKILLDKWRTGIAEVVSI